MYVNKGGGEREIGEGIRDRMDDTMSVWWISSSETGIHDEYDDNEDDDGTRLQAQVLSLLGDVRC